jgi:hypothetical protein
VDNGDGTVTDTSTGFMWVKATHEAVNWEAAITYCENLSFAGYDDWRLPNRNTLQSLVDYSKYKPSIDTEFFPDTVSSYYWSSTTRAYNSGYAWYVSFDYGYVPHLYHKTNSYYVRAVRAGQSWSLGSLVIGSPEQAAMWEPGTDQTITWDTRDIAGNVSISISREGGKEGTFETIAGATENDGSFEWTVQGTESVNCMIKIIPLEQPDKSTVQGLFSIKTPPGLLAGSVTQLSSGTPLSGVTISSNSGQATLSDGNGAYSLELSPGTHEITFAKSGYQTIVISDITITKAETTELNVDLITIGQLFGGAYQVLRFDNTITDISL